LSPLPLDRRLPKVLTYRMATGTTRGTKGKLMIQQKSYKEQANDTEIIHVDWPMTRWSRNVALRQGDPVLPHRTDRRVVLTVSGYPDGDAAA